MSILSIFDEPEVAPIARIAWVPEHDAVVREWWGLMPAVAIGDKIGRSKNSIISRAKRLQLEKLKPAAVPRPPKPPRQDNAADECRKASLFALAKITQELPVAPVEPVNGIPLMDLGPLNCRWVVNDPAPGEEYLFCMKRKVRGCSYCEGHMARAWVPARRDRAA